MFFRFFTLLFIFGFWSFWGGGKFPDSNPPKDPPYLNISSPWADSLMNVLTLEEKIGQLFMVAANGRNTDEHNYLRVDKLITDYGIGGLIYFQSSPLSTVSLVNRFQSKSSIPLMNGIDGEWGLAMRIDSLEPYPWNMTLGAITNDSLIYKMGRALAKECQAMGIHFNFAPVVDVNSNPQNPIINARSYGESVSDVTKKGLALMNGMQDAGVLACAKHFPGHGDTKSDSHKTLPLILHDRASIDSLDLPPFKELIDRGVASVMVAHLNIPSLDTTKNRACSLSPVIVDSLLVQELNFKGLIFTDALNMKGVSSFYESGRLEVEALKAGNDVLLFPEDIPAAFEAILMAVNDSTLAVDRINSSCHKILKAKEWLSLSNFTSIDSLYVREKTLNSQNELLRDEMNENALTLIKNQEDLLPIVGLKNKKIGWLGIGGAPGQIFFNQLKKYASVSAFDEKNENPELYDQLIISLHKSNLSPWKSYEISSKDKQLIKRLSYKTSVSLIVFANPYSLLDAYYLDEVKSILIAYQNSVKMQSTAGQAIFGASKIKGRLPVTLSNKFPFGTSVVRESLGRLKYALPSSVGIDSDTLSLIDSIVHQAIQMKATPGCQVLVAKSGTVVYNKSFGFHTYDEITRVKDSDLYDLASVTKIASILPLIMQKIDAGTFDLDESMISYLNMEDTCSKALLTPREILAHNAQLWPWIPFYKKTLNEDGSKIDSLYSIKNKGLFTIQVAKDLFMHSSYSDSILDRVLHSKMRDEEGYKYSDLPYYLLKSVIEFQENKSLKTLVQERIFEELGANYTTYHPLDKFDIGSIVPTEDDNYFRHQLLRGYVHDPGAAMQDGVGGHAGLFSNSNDIAKLMQMYLNGGIYGGKRFVQERTVIEFTSCQYCETDNRRGIGFDKPLVNEEGGPSCEQASASSYGHSGFTGTLTWADPEHDLIYVFLSNRIHPSAENNLLVKENIRTRIQEVIYKSIL